MLKIAERSISLDMVAQGRASGGDRICDHGADILRQAKKPRFRPATRIDKRSGDSLG